jgi:thiol-disulfide isomerase/thioredoxin
VSRDLGLPKEIIKMSFPLDLSNKYVLAGIAVAAVALSALVYIYVTKYRSKSNTADADDVIEPVAGPGRDPRRPAPLSPDDSPTFVLFHATWCPHCKHMMGDWAETENVLKGKINMKMIESAEPEMAKHKVGGFPTIRMFPRGLNNPDEYVDYTGPRTADGMIKFVMEGPDRE